MSNTQPEQPAKHPHPRPKSNSGKLAKALGALTIATAAAVGACYPAPCNEGDTSCDTANDSCSPEEGEEFVSNIELVNFSRGNNGTLSTTFKIPALPCKGPFKFQNKVGYYLHGSNSYITKVLDGTHTASHEGNVEIQSTGLPQNCDVTEISLAVFDSNGNPIGVSPVEECPLD